MFVKVHSRGNVVDRAQLKAVNRKKKTLRFIPQVFLNTEKQGTKSDSRRERGQLAQKLLVCLIEKLEN